MSAGTRSSAITATAPASSAILACSGVTTSMMTPPFSISAMPRLTRVVPVAGVFSGVLSTMIQMVVPASDNACFRTTHTRCATVTVEAIASAHSAM